jgi:arylsulfatase A-like enzyme
MHIFLIEIRSCHVGYLGCYGNDWLSTPAFDAIAGAGLVFDSHYADLVGEAIGQPAWSTVSCNGGQMLLESLLPDRDCQVQWLGSWAGTGQRPLETDKLFRQLVIRKENSFVAICLNHLSLPWDLSNIPDEVKHETQSEGAEAGTEILNERDTAVLGYREAYGSRVELLDQWLADFMEKLHDSKLLDRAAIIVTADQGISLGEHTTPGTMPAYPYQEIAHLPLIIRLPGEEWAGTRVSTITRASHLSRAILGLLGSEHGGQSGFDLLAWSRESERASHYARTLRVNESGRPTVAIRTPEWAFLIELNTDSPAAQLYRKPDDRWEVNNVLQHYPDVISRLEGLARAIPAP